jgi:hypothetical protein
MDGGGSEVSRGYNLTPLGQGWGWGSRIIEIVVQTISLLLTPVFWIHRGLTAIAERFMR